MKFSKYILIAATIILTSFYLFPFSFVFLPSINTKMMMAASALVILLVRYAKNRMSQIDHSFIRLSLWAILVSIICFFSIVFNNTNDYSYSTYIVSMWVWLGGAYTLVSMIRCVHGVITPQLICNYFIIVCVLQCTLALVIDNVPLFKNWVDSNIGSFGFNSSLGAKEYSRRYRLYGVGAALDFAGTRFSAILIMIGFLIQQNLNKHPKIIPMYMLAFMIIVVIGNMIARTTTVGAIMAIVYLLLIMLYEWTPRYRLVLTWGAVITLISTCTVVVLYNTSPIFKGYIEFGFEGFFSLINSGEWQTNSGNILVNMVRFPETWKTWLIGDGYFENPHSDLYYVGYPWKGFYMGTDIGYLRFIFYFGIFGLIAFIFFFCLVAKECSRKHLQYNRLFFMLLVLNFIIWLKVSTDIFVVFAPFLCFTTHEDSIPDQLDI